MFVQCVCREGVIKERLKARETVRTISDARLHHFSKIKAGFQPLDEVPDEMHIVVDTEKPIEETLGQILARDYALECLQTEKALKVRA
jgi:hypothetical protein